MPRPSQLNAVFDGHAAMIQPHWPALIRHSGDVELTPVTDEGEWRADADLSCWPYETGDCLIDSEGRVFELTYSGKPGGPGAVAIVPTSRVVAASELVAVVRADLACRGKALGEYDYLTAEDVGGSPAWAVKFLDSARS